MFFVRWYLVYSTVYGGFWSVVTFYFVVKTIQGLWLSILTQSHHLPMEISANDKGQDWFTLQVLYYEVVSFQL